MNFEWADHIPELKFLAIAVTTFVALGLVAPGITFLLTKVATPFSFAHDVFLRIRAPLHTLIPLIGLQIVWRSAPPDLTFRNTIAHLITLAIIASVVWLGLRIVDAGRLVIFKRHPIEVSDNRTARRIHTQTQVLVHTLSFFVILFGIAAMLMTFPGAKQIGASLLASAGLAGLAVGFAAKPVLGNLIAGLQIALTQPISLDDVVIVEGEWGRIEEINSTYVVVKIWDERRLIIPLQYFIETPFQNWTRHSTQILGTFTIWVDYAMPIEPLRKELERLCKQVPQWWDGRVVNLQVTNTSEKAIELRALVSSSNSGHNWDLRVYLREHLVKYIASNYPDYLPQLRAQLYEEQEEEKRNERNKLTEKDKEESSAGTSFDTKSLLDKPG
jgi:small-conductance mechanosensitive channel